MTEWTTCTSFGAVFQIEAFVSLELLANIVGTIWSHPFEKRNGHMVMEGIIQARVAELGLL